jgi:hypothetical protein
MGNPYDQGVTRYWVRRGGSIALTAEGFLEDPDSKWSRYVNNDAHPLSEYRDVRCLVLLGEPGMGKSVEIDREFALCQEQGRLSSFAYLGNYDSSELLHSEVFLRPELAALQHGTKEVTLFLDALDEGRLAIKILAQRLNVELERIGAERLRIRIACRTAEWPPLLEQSLRHLWGDDGIEIIELTPLRRSDAIAIASGIVRDPDAFLKQVTKQRVGPLAAKPVTLRLLAATFSARGDEFAATQAGLYRDGCELLCAETNQSRLASNGVGLLTQRERLVVAARLAAIMMFTNRAAVLTSPDLGAQQRNDLALLDATGGVEAIAGVAVQVTDAAIMDALNTGLFSLRGEGRLGWAHQTYAEFLAAWYIREHRFAPPQIDSLFLRSGVGSREHLIPQLYETAARFASVDAPFFQRIVKLEPEVVLRSDVDQVGSSSRAQLIDSLLALAACDALDYSTYDSVDRLAKLDYADLARQLEVPLSACDVRSEVRELAVVIAGASGHKLLHQRVVQIANDTTEAPRARIAAASVISRRSDPEMMIGLRPLIRALDDGEVDTDLDDQLRGWALHALWPRHISAYDLFAALTPQKRQDFLGPYQTFLHYLGGNVTVDMIIPGLEWVARFHESYSFAEDLADEIVWAAWNHIENDDIRSAILPVLITRLEHHDDVAGTKRAEELDADIATNTNRRRLVLETIVPLLPDAKDAAYRLVWTQSRIARVEDIPWMLGHLTRLKPDTEAAWIELISNVFNQDGGNAFFGEVYNRALSHPELAKAFAPIFDAVELTSVLATNQRHYYEMDRASQERRLERHPPQDSRIAIIGQQLDAFDDGEIDAWWRIQVEFGLSDDRKHREDWSARLDKRPLWSHLDGSTRKRLVTAAGEYVRVRESQPTTWLGKSVISFPDVAGVNAIHLLREQSHEDYAQLSVAVWTAWTPMIVGFPIRDADDERAARDEMLLFAYKASPSRVMDTVRGLILSDNERHSNVFFSFDHLEACWALDPAPITQTLMVSMVEDPLAPNSAYTLLRTMMLHHVIDAKQHALKMVEHPVTKSGNADEFAVAAGHALLYGPAREMWTFIQPVLARAPAFGRALVTAVAGDGYDATARLNQELAESELADLHIWLAQQFPRAEADAASDGDDYHTSGFVTPRNYVERWRDGILTVLQERGTLASIDALTRIAGTFPDASGLMRLVRSAEQVTRRETWLPPSPADFLSLVGRSNRRLIEETGQLVDVVLESLTRLQQELQGETPSASTLWERGATTNQRPKDEEAFSDEVVRHFRRDLQSRGIIFNREVEIRHGDGKRPGEEVDIRVEATRSLPTGGPAQVFAAIIESKGCWHHELMTAMKTQLVDRYLLRNPAVSDGIYLVAWFDPTLWDPTDNRQKAMVGVRADIHALQGILSEQAEALSVNGRRIHAVVLDVSIGKKL